MSILDDILEHRWPSTVAGNPLTFVELFGATPVELLFYEPDPNTYRLNYYYNTKLNKLYKKILTPAIGCNSVARYVWKNIINESVN